MKILDKYQEIFLNTEFRQWNSLPRNMMESPLPVSIKTRLVRTGEYTVGNNPALV